MKYTTLTLRSLTLLGLLAAAVPSVHAACVNYYDADTGKLCDSGTSTAAAASEKPKHKSDKDGFFGWGGFAIVNRTTTIAHSVVDTATHTLDVGVSEPMTDGMWGIDFNALLSMDNKQTIQGNYPFLYLRMALGMGNEITDGTSITGRFESDSAAGVRGAPARHIVELSEASSWWMLMKIAFPWQFVDREWLKFGTGMGGGIEGFVTEGGVGGAYLHSFAAIPPVHLLIQHDLQLIGRGQNMFEVYWRPFGGGFTLQAEYVDEFGTDAGRVGLGLGLSFITPDAD